MAYVSLVVLFTASIAPAAFGAATMSRSRTASTAAAHACPAGKVAAQVKKRVRTTVKVKKHGKVKRKRVWVKKSSWVCLTKAAPAPTPAPFAPVTPPVVTPATPAPAADTAAPSAPPNFGAAAGDRQVSLAWGVSTDDVKVVYYQLFRDGVPISAVDARNPRAFLDTGLTNGRAYTYTVAAHDLADNVSATSSATATPADTTAPTVPSGLSAASSDAQVSLTWTASTDNIDVPRYNVYRSTGGGAYALVTLSPIATPYFSDTGLANGTAYSYKVTAVDGSSNASAQSVIVTATPIPPADTQAPSVPAGLAATPGSGQVALAWSASTDNVGVAGYRVYRSVGGGAYAQVGAPAGTSFTDVGLTNGTAYSYKVAAVDAATNASAQSAAVAATPADTTAPTVPAGLSTTAGDAQVDLAWTASTDNVGVLSYNVYRSTGGGAYALIGSAATPFFHDSGLTNGTAYSYKVAALDASSNGSAQSAAASATPVAAGDTQAPSVPGGLAATAGSRQVALSWSASTDNVGVTGYRVYRSVGGGAYAQVGTPAGTTFTDVGLTNGTAYSYKVAAVDAAANASAQSAAVSGTPADTTPPSIPAGLSATAGDAQVALSWAASTDNVSVTGYTVYRSIGGGPYVAIGSPASTFFTDTLLTNGTVYSYKIAAIDSSANASAQSAAASATPVASADTQAPTVPSGLTATAGTNQVALAWSAASDNVGVTGYRVYRSFGGGAYAQVAAPAGTSYTDTGLTNGTAYSYKLSAVDAATNQSAQSAAVSAMPADTQAPTVPGGLSATAGDTQVALSWTASSDIVGVTGYRVYRSTGGGAYALVGSPAGVSYTDTGLTNGTAYSYKVAAVDGSANASAQSAAASATPVAPPDTQAPTVPAGLTATPSSTQVALLWTASSDNVAVTGYRVYRSVGGGAYSQIAAPAGTSYTDTGLTNGTAYSYKVAAADAAANVSAQSAAVSGTPADTTPPSVPAGLAATAGDTQVSLAWGASSDNVAVTGYRVYRSVGGGAYVLIGSPSTPFYSDTGLTNNTAYSYKVASIDGSANLSAQSAAASATPVAPAAGDTQAPTVPSGLTATGGTNQVALAWSASSDNVGVTGYRVYRSVGGGAYALIASPAGPSYTDTGLTNGTAYSYKVAAIDAAANLSAQSGAVTGTPTDTTPPTAPTNVTLTKNGAAHTITIAWTASTDNVGIVKYRLVRNGALAAQPTGTSYVDADLANGATYGYTVAAVDAAGNISAASPLVSTFVS